MAQVLIDDTSRKILIYLAAADILGILISILILTSVFRKPIIINANNLPTVNIVIAGTVFATSALPLDLINIDASENQVSVFMCQISGLTTMASGTVMFVTVAFTAVYRYFVIVLEHRAFSSRQMIYTLGGIWITFYSLWLIPVLAPDHLVDRLEVSSFGGACTPNFTTRKPISLSISIATIACIVITPIHMMLAYRAILKKLIRAKQAVSEFGLTTSTINEADRLKMETHTSSYYDPERIITKHAMVMTSLYSFFWTPVAILWIFECISGQYPAHYIVGLCHMFPATYSYVNPLALLYIDKTFRDAFYEFLGLSAFTKTPSNIPYASKKRLGPKELNQNLAKATLATESATE